jgi:hypothetical protein
MFNSRLGGWLYWLRLVVILSASRGEQVTRRSFERRRRKTSIVRNATDIRNGLLSEYSLLFSYLAYAVLNTL